MTEKEKTLVNAMDSTMNMIESIKVQMKNILDNIDCVSSEKNKKMIQTGTIYLQKAQGDLWNALGQFCTPSQDIINIEPNTEEDLKRICQELGRPFPEKEAI